MINIVEMALKEFSTMYVFEGLTEEQIHAISALLEAREYIKDDVIFEQGQEAGYLFILKDGEVSISYKPYDGPPISVSVISSGGVFGWSTALGRDCYTSSAIAQTDCELLCISGSQLKSFCKEDNVTGIILLDRLAGVIAERLNQTHAQILSILTKGSNCQEEG